MTGFSHRMPFGAEIGQAGVRFRLWAPDAKSVALCLGAGADEQVLPLERDASGWCETTVEGDRRRQPLPLPDRRRPEGAGPGVAVPA